MSNDPRNDPPFKDAVVLLDAPFRPNVELMRAIRDAAAPPEPKEDDFPDAWDCYWAGYPCPDCGTHVPACACGDWGCNLSSHTALVCPAFRDDDMLDDKVRCECGHLAEMHRSDRSCRCGMSVEGCPCEFFSPLQPTL